MEKNILRQQMKEKLALLNKPLYEKKSYEIAKKLYNDSDWLGANTIGITISNPPEVDTYQIIRKAWELGKTIVVPKCDSKKKQMTFRVLKHFSQLEKVFFGLYEPIEDETKELDASEIDLHIVPGLSFTRKGYRLGFGGGYYDRYLADFHGSLVSLCFDIQIVEELPIEEHDLPVGKIITELEVIKTYD